MRGMLDQLTQVAAEEGPPFGLEDVQWYQHGE